MKTRSNRAIAVTLSACILFASQHAKADDQAIVDAQARFADGLDRARRGDFDAARLAFVQAYAVLKSPEILYNLAVSEQKTSRTLEALRHFRQLMHDTRTANDDRAAAKTRIDQLVKLTGHLVVHAPEGSLVRVDGQPATLDTDPVDVMPGAHLIEGRLGSKTSQTQATTAAGETVEVTLAIAPDAPPPIDASTHEPKGRIPVTIALGAVAVAAFGTGVFFAIDSQNKKDDADAYRQSHGPGVCAPGSSSCAGYQSALDDQQRSVTIAQILYVSSAVLAVAAIGTFVLWPRGKKSEHAFIAPTFGGARAGFSF